MGNGSVNPTLASSSSDDLFCDAYNNLPDFIRKLDPEGPSGVYRADFDLRENLSARDYNGPTNRLHTDIPRLRGGQIGCQFWNVYLPSNVVGPKAVQSAVEQVDVVIRMVDRYEDLELALCAEDIHRIFANGNIASVIGLEGGQLINGSLSILRMYYRLGVRYMSFTGNGGPSWADSALDHNGIAQYHTPNNGLSVFGYQVVNEMNRIGMMIDLSSAHHSTVEKVLEATRAPVIFTHSYCHTLLPSAKGVTDEALLALKENKGMIMVTFTGVIGGQTQGTVSDVANHIDHVRKVAGIDHIGIGGGFNGSEQVSVGLEDSSCYPTLQAELIKRGYTDADRRKIFSKNILRVMEEVVNVKTKMRTITPNENQCIQADKGPTTAYQSHLPIIPVSLYTSTTPTMTESFHKSARSIKPIPIFPQTDKSVAFQDHTNLSSSHPTTLCRKESMKYLQMY